MRQFAVEGQAKKFVPVVSLKPQTFRISRPGALVINDNCRTIVVRMPHARIATLNRNDVSGASQPMLHPWLHRCVPC